MARAQAKTNNSNKSSSKKPEAPPPAATPITNVAPAVQAVPAKKETPVVQAAPVVQTAAAPARSRPSAEQISRRAYELFLARGGEHGHHDEDWIQAERELQLGR
ncbi:DUF2934 domain-containing protein [Cystobacter fuscus]|uniref:DUF2934 domain-containing protein n=1 Tax=Cystobacter fuscus TaxID=43 RepID=UPI002B30E25C|nr:DUF2934 domain-containing protein [Cystobacter fuscus]